MQAYDTGVDLHLRRLLDAGYEAQFTVPPAGCDTPACMVAVTTGTGSQWHGAGDTPAAALRSAWPLGYRPGQGGCGHCHGLGCILPGCPTCAGWLGGQAVSGVCGVCGCTSPGATDDNEDHDEEEDDEEPYCTVCSASVSIFLGHGDAWLHYTGQGTVASPVELPDAGHEPVVAWREAGVR